MRHTRRVTPALLAAVAALALGACGSDGGDDEPKYDADQVQERFEDLTGVELDSSSVGGDLVSLRPQIDSRSNPGYRRYSGITIYVADGGDALESLEDRGPSRDKRRFDNVLVTSSSGADRGEEAFARTVRVLASLGKPAGQARLKPEDTLCDRAGIDPEGGDGKAGRCIDEGREVTVVNADDDLELDQVTVSDVEVATGTRLIERRFGQDDVQRATGRFLLVRYELFNTGSEPITTLRPGLVVDGKHFTEDFEAGFSVRPRGVFPLQPGAGARSVSVFDLPAAAAEDFEDGALEIPVSLSGLGSSYEYADGIGRVRLEGAGKAPRRFGTARLSN